jgi:hypothetical protein
MILPRKRGDTVFLLKGVRSPLIFFSKCDIKKEALFVENPGLNSSRARIKNAFPRCNNATTRFTQSLSD